MCAETPKRELKESKEVYRKKAREQVPAEQHAGCVLRDEKDHWCKGKKDQTDGRLERANELNVFFNRFSSGGETATSLPAQSHTDLTPSTDPQLQSGLYSTG